MKLTRKCENAVGLVVEDKYEPIELSRLVLDSFDIWQVEDGA